MRKEAFFLVLIQAGPAGMRFALRLLRAHGGGAAEGQSGADAS